MGANIITTKELVTYLDPDSLDATVWGVNIEWRGDDKYAVTHLSSCLNDVGEWVHEPIPSSRTDEFIAATRFDYDIARRWAIAVADTVVVNGMNWRDVADKKMSAEGDTE